MIRFLFTLAVAMAAVAPVARADQAILNVSYDATRELYAAAGKIFAERWKKETGETVTIQNSNGGSGAQARSVIDGLEADTVTLALSQDIDAIARQSKLLPLDWQKKLPENSSPYTSTVVFLVRKGNPKAVKDWSDLVKPGMRLLAPNPKTGGGSRWIYLAAWGYALQQPGGDDTKAREFVTAFYRNMLILDSGARGSTTNFIQRRQGDVLVTWENEAKLALDEAGKDNYEVVVPSMSILAEPPVAVVEKVAEKHGTQKVAEAFLRFLYTLEGQELVAKYHYRPRLAEVAARHEAEMPKLKLFDISLFGGWDKAQATHFADGAIFDQIYQPAK